MTPKRWVGLVLAMGLTPQGNRSGHTGVKAALGRSFRRIPSKPERWAPPARWQKGSGSPFSAPRDGAAPQGRGTHGPALPAVRGLAGNVEERRGFA